MIRLQLSEQVWLDLEAASFGSRGLAFIIDWTLRSVIFVGFLYLFYGNLTPLQDLLQNQDILEALAIVVFFLIDWVYAIAFEVWCNGVSPGKKIMGLRVVDLRGLPITYKRSFVRNLLNPLDIALLGTTALVSMLVSKKSQRLGDIVAGTMVVYEPEVVSSDSLESSAGSMTAIPKELYSAMHELIRRQRELAPNAKAKVIGQIYAALGEEYRFAAKRVKAPPPEKTKQALEWIENQLKVVTPSKRDDWDKINNELILMDKKLRRFQSRKLSSADLKALSRSYQTICNLYAYLQSYFPQTVQSKFASSLLRTGRRIIYGRRLEQLNASKEGFLSRLGLQFGLIKYHIALSALLFFGGAALAGMFVAINPSLGWSIIDEAGDAALRSGEIWTDSIQGSSSSAAAIIMTNNIKVSFMAFAGGVSAGVLTAITMIFNGVHLGSIFSLLGSYNMDHRLLDFVVAHGFLELSVIVVSGGAGFYLGDAVINPGSLSRAQALGKNASAIFDVIVFNIACLIFAGIVEGYISPYPVGLTAKTALGVLLGILYWLMLASLSPTIGRRSLGVGMSRRSA